MVGIVSDLGKGSKYRKYLMNEEEEQRIQSKQQEVEMRRNSAMLPSLSVFVFLSAQFKCLCLLSLASKKENGSLYWTASSFNGRCRIENLGFRCYILHCGSSSVNV